MEDLFRRMVVPDLGGRSFRRMVATYPVTVYARRPYFRTCLYVSTYRRTCQWHPSPKVKYSTPLLHIDSELCERTGHTLAISDVQHGCLLTRRRHRRAEYSKTSRDSADNFKHLRAETLRPELHCIGNRRWNGIFQSGNEIGSGEVHTMHRNS